MGLAGPVVVNELAEGVDHGKELFGVDPFGGTGNGDIVDCEAVVDLGIGDEDEDLGDVGGVEGAGGFWPAAHTDDFGGFGEDPGGGVEANGQCAFFVRVELDISVDAVFATICTGVVYATGYFDFFGAFVFDVHCEFEILAQVPFAIGCFKGDSGPTVFVTRANAKCAGNLEDLCVAGFDLADVKAGIEIEEVYLGWGDLW